MKMRVLYRIFIIVLPAFIFFAEVNVSAQEFKKIPKNFAFENRGDGTDSAFPTLDYYSNQTRVGSFDVLRNICNIYFLLGHKGGVLGQIALNMDTGERFPVWGSLSFCEYFHKYDYQLSELLSEVFPKNEIEEMNAIFNGEDVSNIFITCAINPRTGKIVDFEFGLSLHPDSGKGLLSIPVERFERLESFIKERWVFSDAPEESKVFDYIPYSTNILPINL